MARFTRVSEQELQALEAPPPVGRWYPIAHSKVFAAVRCNLIEAGYKIAAQQLAIGKQDKRFFGTLDLDAPLVSGVVLAVGIGSSYDKSYPLVFTAGTRVIACSNLAFRSELLVKKKHTTHGEERFMGDIPKAVAGLGHFRLLETERIKVLSSMQLDDVLADALILRAFEKGVVNSHQLPNFAVSVRSVVQTVEVASDCAVSNGRTALPRCAAIGG